MAKSIKPKFEVGENKVQILHTFYEIQSELFF